MQPQKNEQEWEQVNGLDRAFASRFAKNMFFTLLTIVMLSFIGSRFFTHLDLNLYGYMVGTIIFLAGFFYRFMAWAERPPTKVFIQKGKKLLFRKNTASTSVDHMVSHKFIWNRGIYRWTQHMLIGWGCILSCFVTFPLVFGWMYFTMAENGMYTVVFMSIDVMEVRADGLLAWLFYNALNISAIMVIAGVCMALYRRLKNEKQCAEQTFIYDFMPLYLLLFISVSGLLLTVTNVFFAGFMQPTISLIHQYAVIVTLIYLPFGKLAHIPIRPLSVLAKNYKLHYGEQEMKKCHHCGNEFIAAEQSADVIDVLRQNGMEYKTEDGVHLAELCLPCRRETRLQMFKHASASMLSVGRGERT
ncbi:hypothetical protein [Longirhabdus pacifica]|uniref:hypothetical protein n=1 Tax=Longirhabdus pacifica TaxID=2305227 RepID=UPI001008FF0E|nr:hypothetical protein [Longirhabdus pacifica]